MIFDLKRVLVLATNSEIVQSIKEILTPQFNVIFAKNAGLIFDEVDKHKPDVLLMDFILHDTNSAAITHQLKCDQATQNLPIIIMSDYPELFKQSVKFGCDGFIQKPLNHYLLLEKINCCISKRGLVHLEVPSYSAAAL